jgi:hypothetical protein
MTEPADSIDQSDDKGPEAAGAERQIYDARLAEPLNQPADPIPREKLATVGIATAVFLLYLLSNPAPASFFDYTFRIAEAMLHGELGLTQRPESWLNEMIPFGNYFYSAFPLGSVLCMIPFAALKVARVIGSMPGSLIAALLASSAAYFFFRISAKYRDSLFRRILLTLFPVLGTWMWANLAYGGAWQLALGFAVLGEAGALYFTLIKPRPLLSGAFFAMAFGNRTEIMLSAPLFLYFLLRQPQSPEDSLSFSARLRAFGARAWKRRDEIGCFLTVPIVLGVLTLAYNFARFGSPLDFGYMRIPGVQKEEWYKHGLFSIQAIPDNALTMLWYGWRVLDHKPYLVPRGFGGSILLSSPILVLLFRRKLRDRPMVIASWIAIISLTLVLWLHGNPGGWQVSYRYAMILLPWMFLVLLDNGRARTSLAEMMLFVLSVSINVYATYEFLWTSNMQP